MEDRALLTFFYPWPGVVAIPRLTPKDRHRATSLHKGQSVAVHVNQLLRLHIVSYMAVCIHSSAFVPHPFGRE